MLGGESMRVWLKKKRESKNLTHQEVADECEISRSYYTLIENDLKTPTPKVAQKIGKVLEFSWTNFFRN